jgi:glycosyltransferase involved in cell wall biosynthesis
MSENTPLITVIVAVFNGADTLQRCIDSVVKQTYPATELIVMDGGSTDGTVEILQANSGEITYWESRPDQGIYHAWNKALNHARGEWIGFLGVDDYFWRSDVLEQLAPHLMAAAMRGIHVVYGQVAVLTGKGKLLEISGEPWEKVEKRFQEEMAIPHQGTMHHRSLFETHGVFDESFRISGDYDLLLRELRKNSAQFIPGIIVTGMQLGGLSSVPALQVVHVREVKRARDKNQITAFSPRLFRRLVRAIIRLSIAEVFGQKRTDFVVDIYRILTGKPRKWTA